MMTSNRNMIPASKTITCVSFGNLEYGITFFEDRFGVCKDGGRVKYMPVVWKYDAHYFPVLHKTRLSMAGTAADLFENISLCARIKSSALECVRICEHVLAYGHTPR